MILGIKDDEIFISHYLIDDSSRTAMSLFCSLVHFPISSLYFLYYLILSLTVNATSIAKYANKTGQNTGISTALVDVPIKLNIAANVIFFQSLNSFFDGINVPLS